MKSRRRRAVSIALGCVLLGGPAAAGVIVTVETSNEATGSTTITRTLLSGSRMRVDESDKSTVVQPDLKKLLELSQSSKTYFEITPADLERRRLASGEARRKMLASSGFAAPAIADVSAPAAIRYTKIASGQQAGSWTCDLFAKEINGMKVSEVCVAPLARVGIQKKDLKPIAGATKVFGAAPSRWDQEAASLLKRAKEIGYDAYPVRIEVLTVDGNIMAVSQLRTVTQIKIPPQTFQLPTGFTSAPTSALQ